MKRSEINAIMREAIAFLEERRFYLPPFAHWTPEEWRTKGPEEAEIVQNMLGWDITDFGSGDFAHTGLFLFTVRNGRAENLETMSGKVYAEKIMIAREGQVTPLHFHWKKTEDIIDRGGGNLMIRLYNSSADGSDLLKSEVVVSMDGVRRRVPAGGTVTLHPGESITLVPGLYHEFWGEPGHGQVLVGEVSMVNDDRTDNRFYQPVGRFPDIEEDEPPLHLLAADYAWYCRGSGCATGTATT